MNKITNKINLVNDVWKQKIETINIDPMYVANPRGMEVKEIITGQYTLPMPAFLDLVDRKINVPFMFSEAAWIISGSNLLSVVSEYMKGYARYSDDNIFMRGAYGPKVIDQFGYVVDCLENDRDSRQAVMNIWRERPGISKDIPCTTNMQFLIRDNELHMVTTMRSQDIVMGFTYDVFTFSMVAFAVKLLLAERNIDVKLGQLTVTAGSMHLYNNHYDEVQKWTKSEERDLMISAYVENVLSSKTYSELINKLQNTAALAYDVKVKK